MKSYEKIIFLIFLIIESNSLKLKLEKKKDNFKSLFSFLSDLSDTLQQNSKKISNEKKKTKEKDNSEVKEARIAVEKIINEPKKEAKEILKSVSENVDKTFKEMKNEFDIKVEEILNGTYKEVSQNNNEDNNINIEVETPQINVDSNDINLNVDLPQVNVTIPKIEICKQIKKK